MGRFVRSTLPLLALLALAGCATLAGCAVKESELQPVFASPQAIETVRTAPTVTAQLLAGDSYHREKSSEYETRGEPVALTPDQAQVVRELLLDPTSYDFYSAKGCQPNYGVRLRFESAGEVVDVLLCFDCDILAVYRDDADVGGEDFDRVTNEFRLLMKELFPDDSAIQGLFSDSVPRGTHVPRSPDDAP